MSAPGWSLLRARALSRLAVVAMPALLTMALLAVVMAVVASTLAVAAAMTVSLTGDIQQSLRTAKAGRERIDRSGPEVDRAEVPRKCG